MSLSEMLRNEEVVGFSSPVTATAAPLPLPTRIAFVGNYLPRQCGIATFTTDLCEAIAARYGEKTCFAVPVTDKKNIYNYPPRVRFEIAEQDLESYRKAADFLNHAE